MQQNECLNRALTRLYRSLLQYARECWPWTGDGAAEREAIRRAAEVQQESVGRIVELLSNRDWPIDFGRYPSDLSSLHYVAFDYLLKRLVADQEALVAELNQAVIACEDDPAAVELLNEIAARERENLQTLRSLSETPRAATAS